MGKCVQSNSNRNRNSGSKKHYTMPDNIGHTGNGDVYEALHVINETVKDWMKKNGEDWEELRNTTKRLDALEASQHKSLKELYAKQSLELAEKENELVWRTDKFSEQRERVNKLREEYYCMRGKFQNRENHLTEKAIEFQHGELHDIVTDRMEGKRCEEVTCSTDVAAVAVPKRMMKKGKKYGPSRGASSQTAQAADDAPRYGSLRVVTELKHSRKNRATHNVRTPMNMIRQSSPKNLKPKQPSDRMRETVKVSEPYSRKRNPERSKRSQERSRTRSRDRRSMSSRHQHSKRSSSKHLDSANRYRPRHARSKQQYSKQQYTKQHAKQRPHAKRTNYAHKHQYQHAYEHSPRPEHRSKWSLHRESRPREPRDSSHRSLSGLSGLSGLTPSQSRSRAGSNDEKRRTSHGGQTQAPSSPKSDGGQDIRSLSRASARTRRVSLTSPQSPCEPSVPPARTPPKRKQQRGRSATSRTFKSPDARQDDLDKITTTANATSSSCESPLKVGKSDSAAVHEGVMSGLAR